MWRNSLGALGVMGLYWTLGLVLVRQVWGRPWRGAVALGWLLGGGVASLNLLAIHVAGGALRPGLPIVLAGQLLAALAWRRWRPRPARPAPGDRPPGVRTGWLAWGALAALAVVLLALLLQGLTQPEIRFDALHNWSFKALSTAVQGRPFQGNWPFVLFPNHVPFLGATFLGFQGFPQETVAHLIPWLFYVTLLGVLVAAARRLSGSWSWGLPMALLMMTANTMMLSHTDRFYCDLPLAALHLASVYLAIAWLTGDRLAALFLSGLFSGLGMWTKTEGLLLAAGVGGSLLLAECLRADTKWSVTGKALGVWLGGLLLTGGPWPLYLLLNRIAADSSGHIGQAWEWDRLPVILRASWDYFARSGRSASFSLLFFLALGLSKKTRSLYVFLAATIAAGFLHAWLPLLIVPADAFGGWKTFMNNGLTRYFMHFMPVMLLAAALVARTGRVAGLERLLHRLMLRAPRRPRTAPPA